MNITANAPNRIDARYLSDHQGRILLSPDDILFPVESSRAEAIRIVDSLDALERMSLEMRFVQRNRSWKSALMDTRGAMRGQSRWLCEELLDRTLENALSKLRKGLGIDPEVNEAP